MELVYSADESTKVVVRRITRSFLMRALGFSVTATYTIGLLAVLIILPCVVRAAAPPTLDQEFLATAAHGDLAKVKSLLRKGANINAGNGSALMDSARRGHDEVVRFLLEEGIDANAVTTHTFHPYNPIPWRREEPRTYSQSELEAKARYSELSGEGHRDVLRLRTIGIALIEAALRGHTDVVRAILSKGVDSEAAGFAMKWAALQGHMDIAKLLIERGAAVDARSGSGRTALMEFSRTGRSNVVRMLLNARADVGLRDEYGASALTLAVEAGHTDVVHMLVESGADINVQDCFSLTALMRAAKKGYVRTAEILLEKGADFELRSMYGWTAVAWACFQGSPEVVKALIANGANINVKTEHGWTPLMLAAFKGHTEVVRLLLDKGVHVHLRNARGWTAQDYALAAKHFDIYALIVRRDGGE